MKSILKSVKERARLKLLLVLFPAAFSGQAFATKLFIPMDAGGQTNHLKAYGIAFAAMKDGQPVSWMLNYKGGSFGMEYTKKLADMCTQREVSFTKMSDKELADVMKEVSGLKYQGQVIKLVKPPRIAVYTPLNKEPWDDAVTLALTYAEIPFEKVYAEEALNGKLDNYDWLHLHHEDFTGQYGKFWAQFRAAQWYNNDQNAAERLARKLGFKKVSQMQLAVVKRIAKFVSGGGNLFAMCSATDTYDIALAAEGVDICETQFDNDPMDADAQQKLNYAPCFAFKDFKLSVSPYEYEYSNIDNSDFRKLEEAADVFTINEFPTKLDPVPAMLCQNHTTVVKGFFGQTTAFRKEIIKSRVVILAENKALNEARYIHGDMDKGSWTFYGGHDPEDYKHSVGAPPTNLAFHRSSPGYRLILNNVLSPAAERKSVPTVVMNAANPAVTSTLPATASTLKMESDAIKILPDPGNNSLKIVLPASLINSKPVQIVITNTTGMEVINKSFGADNINISLGTLTPGVYLIQVNGQYAGKLMKD
ncbi:MAG: T9SS type A sorting domain-containing protein [Taibaiella sp.]|nr:T9SS type A sorting domain-containing protein [Taibaiella sp.]